MVWMFLHAMSAACVIASSLHKAQLLAMTRRGSFFLRVFSEKTIYPLIDFPVLLF
jgi:hypothetical protein